MISYCLNNPSKHYFPLKYISLSSRYYFRGIILSQKKVDLLGQYIGAVLIPRLNNANNLFEQGKHFEALSSLKSVIRALYRAPRNNEDIDKDQEALDSWIKEITVIENNSINSRGFARIARKYRSSREKNQDAMKLYEKLDYAIWGKLHEFGYFSGKKSYGPPMKDINFETAVSL